MNKLKGIYAALVTPFGADGSLDLQALEKLIETNMEEGVTGFYLSGSTGESFMMTNEERKQLIKRAAQIVNHRVPLLANVGSFSLGQALDMAKAAQEAGLEAVSSVPPFYFPFNKEEIKDYYRSLQKESGMPLLIYNIPKMSGVSFSTEDLDELLQEPGIIGAKQTTFDLFQTEQIVRKYPEKSIFNGHDEIFLSAMAVGVEATIGTTVSIMPELFLAVIDGVHKGDLAKARQAQGRINDVVEKLLSIGIFKGVKAILALRGLDCGHCRAPFAPLSKEKMAVAEETEDMIQSWRK
jgi:N-acetylneuraminate lyase